LYDFPHWSDIRDGVGALKADGKTLAGASSGRRKWIRRVAMKRSFMEIFGRPVAVARAGGSASNFRLGAAFGLS